MPRWSTLAALLLVTGCADPALLGPADAGALGDHDGAPSTGDATSLASRCTASAEAIHCARQTRALGAGAVEREVHFQVPLGVPPQAGWPAVILFQGSYYSAERSFDGAAGDAHGAYWQAAAVKALLDAGYAVIAPETRLDGATWWDTNVAPWATSWTASPDHAFMLALFGEMTAGALGALDDTRWFAAGISSGGYMTSRMAAAYPGRLRALAIHSASWATCSVLCVLPAELPTGHPPTLFLHGAEDAIVPLATMTPYADALLEMGIETRTVIDPTAGHEWLPVAPTELVSWFGEAP